MSSSKGCPAQFVALTAAASVSVYGYGVIPDCGHYSLHLCSISLFACTAVGAAPYKLGAELLNHFLCTQEKLVTGPTCDFGCHDGKAQTVLKHLELS